MYSSVLYLQVNDRLAGVINSSFIDKDIEFMVATSAQEAIKVYSERDIMITIVDSPIPDMKLSDFVNKCEREYPRMRLDVCVDTLNAKFIGNISRHPNVGKIYLPPYDANEIVEGVFASLDEMCLARDLERRQEEQQAEEERLENTLANLRAALVRQQYSYNKLEPFFDKLIEVFQERSEWDEGTKHFLTKSCKKILKLETTASFKGHTLEEIIRNQLSEAIGSNKRIFIGDVKSSVNSDGDRSLVIKIVYLLWLLTLMVSKSTDELTIEVDSAGAKNEVIKYDFLARSEGAIWVDGNILEYVKCILECLTSEYDISEIDGGFKVSLEL